VTILSFSYDGKHRFDDVHVGEEVDLKDLIYQAYCSTALSQLFYGTDNSYKSHRLVEAMLM
jgi:hypothetical protein